MTRTTDPRSTGVTSGSSGAAETPQGRAMQLVAQAHALCDEGRPAEAEDMCRWVLNQAPNLASAQVALGRARFEQGHLQEARAILDAAVTKHPAFFTGHRWLAEVLVRLGDWPSASSVLVRAEALSPGQPRIAELVRQVMGMGPPAAVRGTGPVPTYAGPSRTTEETTPAPPPLPPPQRTPPSAQRRRTYLGPAVADLVPDPEPSPPAPPVRLSSARAVPGNTPTRRLAVPPDPPFIAPADSPPSTPTDQRRTPPASPGGRLAVSGERYRGRWQLARARVHQWARRHPRAALVVVSIALFTLAALGMLLLAWVLRPSNPATTDGRLEPSAGEAAAVPPLRAAAFDELASIMTGDRRLHGRASLATTGRALLAEALMSTEYGRPVAPESETLADELGRAGGGEKLEELSAARVLFRLARGDRQDAGELAATLGLRGASSPVLRFVEARRLAREGDGAAALALLGPEAADSPFVPARLLAAELHLDRGDPETALMLARGVLTASPGHPMGAQLLLEATHGLGASMGAAEAAIIERGCRAAEGRVLTLAAACRLNRGLLFRRDGQRQAALGQSFAAMEIAPAEPRLLAQIALLLVNLGATYEAHSLVRRAEALADRRLPALAWARAGVTLATNRKVVVPRGMPPGPEARLIALRASFVGPAVSPAGTSVLAAVARKPPLDTDLRWVADGTRSKGKTGAQTLARRVRNRHGGRPPGPVAAFVAGALARRAGQDVLARLWLSRSLDGHGDACRAATLYRMVLAEGGKNPRMVAELQRAIGRLGCERFVGSPRGE